jgi:hypothetical protein
MESSTASLDSLKAGPLRAGSFFISVGASIVALSIIIAIMGSAIEVAAIAFLLGVFTILMAAFEKDAFKLILLTHPALFYVGTTLLYATLNWNLSLEGLQNGPLAFEIVLLYQLAILCAYVLTALSGLKQNTSVNNIFQPTNQSRAKFLAFFAGTLLALSVLPSLQQLIPLRPIFLVVTLFCTAIYIENKSSGFSLFIALCSALPALVVALAQNQRTPILLYLVFWGVLYVLKQKNISLVKIVLIGLLGLFFSNLITESFIRARLEYQAGHVASAPTRTLELIFSGESIWSAIPILGQSSDVKKLTNESSLYHSAFLRKSYSNEANDLGFLARTALIAYIDIVAPRVETRNDNIDWNSVQGILLSVIPDIGQTKELIYSDKLVWSLGLRGTETIGRPLVTIPGELFSIGGFGFLFLSSLALYFLLFLEINWTRQYLHSSIVCNATLLVLFYDVIFTGTALSAISVGLRNFPLLFVVAIFISRGPTYIGSNAERVRA